MTNRTQRMIELYRSGMTLAEVGEEFGLTKQRVWQILSDAAPDILRVAAPSITDGQARAIRFLGGLGRTPTEIAKAVGVSRPTVYRYLRRKAQA